MKKTINFKGSRCHSCNRKDARYTVKWVRTIQLNPGDVPQLEARGIKACCASCALRFYRGATKPRQEGFAYHTQYVKGSLAKIA